MISTADFSKGTRFLYNGAPYTILDVSIQSPTARGGGTLVKIKARNLLTGEFLSEQFKAGTKFEEPDIVSRHVQFLYLAGEEAVFMDQESYDQFQLPVASIGNPAKYLREDIKIRATYFEGKPVNIELPAHVAVKVDSVEPGTRGNTANSVVLTNAVLDNGVTVRVPLNIKEGDEILVDVNEDTFYQRVHEGKGRF